MSVSIDSIFVKNAFSSPSEFYMDYFIFKEIDTGEVVIVPESVETK